MFQSVFLMNKETQQSIKIRWIRAVYRQRRQDWQHVARKGSMSVSCVPLGLGLFFPATLVRLLPIVQLMPVF